MSRRRSKFLSLVMYLLVISVSSRFAYYKAVTSAYAADVPLFHFNVEDDSSNGGNDRSDPTGTRPGNLVPGPGDTSGNNQEPDGGDGGDGGDGDGGDNGGENDNGSGSGGSESGGGSSSESSETE